MTGSEKQLARAEAGTCPLYRPKGYMAKERSRKKVISKKSWYKPFSTVLFCPPTPNSLLASVLRGIVNEETKAKDWSVKVIERAGVKLQNQDPGLKELSSCNKTDCFIHTSEGARGTVGERAWYMKRPASPARIGSQ